MKAATRSLWRRLTTARGERTAAQERRTRLLLSVLVCLIALSMAAIATIPVQYALAHTQEERRTVLVIYPILDTVLFLSLLGIYRVARAGHLKAAGALVSLLAMVVSYASVLGTGEQMGLLALGLGPLISGLLLTRRETLILSLVATGAMMSLPLVAPGLNYLEVISSILLMLALVTLSVVSAWAHDRDLEQIEEQSRRIRDDMERVAGARKMESIARLASGVAHEFNNIMGAVMGYAEAIGLRPAQANKYAAKILDAARRASRQTEHLLSFSRQQLLRPVPVSLNDLVSRLGHRVGRKVALDLGPEPVWALVDPALMERALETLVSRAEHQAGPQGEVAVRTGSETVKTGDATLPPGPYRTVTIRDSGRPLDNEILYRVFDPFHTRGEFGTGDMDLAAAYGIVAQSGGHLAARRGKAGGNVFVVHLPAAIPPGTT